MAAQRLGLVKPREPAAQGSGAVRQPMVLRVVWDGTSAQIIGVDAETVA